MEANTRPIRPDAQKKQGGVRRAAASDVPPFLARAASAIASDKSIEERLQDVARVVVASAPHTACAIDLDELGVLHRAAMATGALYHGGALSAPAQPNRGAGLAALTDFAALPLVIDGRQLGSLVIAANEGTKHENGSLTAIARLVATAVAASRAGAEMEVLMRRQHLLLSRAEEELRATLAHASLAVHAALARAPVRDRRQTRMHLDAIHRATTRMRALIEYMTETWNACPLQPDLKLDVVAVRSLLRSAIDQCTPFALEKHAPVMVDCRAELVQCDEKRSIAAISAVLRHLLLERAPSEPVAIVVEPSGTSAVRFSCGPTNEPQGVDTFALITARALVLAQKGAFDQVDGSISIWLPSP